MTDPTSAQRQPEPDVDDILQLAAIIRKVDGNNSLGAAALAEEILSHPHSRWTADRAQRQPVPPEPREVEELVGLIRQIALAWEPDATLLGNMTAGQLARTADLLAQRYPQPVPVSERLPNLSPDAGDFNDESLLW